MGPLVLLGLPVAVWLALNSKKKTSSPGPEPTPHPDTPPDFSMPTDWMDLTESPFLVALPGTHTGGPNDPRDMAILYKVEQLAKQGLLADMPGSPAWGSIFVSDGDLAARVPVMLDALRLDGVRVNGTFELVQRIADLLGVFPLTDKVVDAIHQQANTRILPSLHGDTGDWMDRGEGAWTRHMIEHSHEVDNRIAEAEAIPGDPGLVTNVGKHWILHHRNWESADPFTGVAYGDPHGVNFGWYKNTNPADLTKWQAPGNKHNIWHADYSQVVRLMGSSIYLQTPDGEVEVPTAEALTSPELAGLLLNSGKPLPGSRHPAIPPHPYIFA